MEISEILDVVGGIKHSPCVGGGARVATGRWFLPAAARATFLPVPPGTMGRPTRLRGSWPPTHPPELGGGSLPAPPRAARRGMRRTPGGAGTPRDLITT